jgi:hypothetical protein
VDRPLYVPAVQYAIGTRIYCGGSTSIQFAQATVPECQWAQSHEKRTVWIVATLSTTKHIHPISQRRAWQFQGIVVEAI